MVRMCVSLCYQKPGYRPATNAAVSCSVTFETIFERGCNTSGQLGAIGSTQDLCVFPKVANFNVMRECFYRDV